LKTSSPLKRNDPSRVPDRLFGDPAHPVARFLEDGAFQLEHLGAALGEVSDREAVSRRDGSGFQREHPGKDLEQGRFAGAVRADQHRALSSLDLEIESLVDDMIAVRLTHPFQGDDALSGALGLGKLKETVASSGSGARSVPSGLVA